VLDLTLTDGRITHPDLPAAIEGIALRLHAVPETLAVRELDARLGESRINARATVTGYQRDPRLQAAIDAAVDLATIAPLLPPEDSLSVGGRAIADLTVGGLVAVPESFRLGGRLQLAAVHAAGPRLPAPARAVDADLMLRGEQLLIRRLSGSLGASSASVSGSIGNFLALDPRRSVEEVAVIELDLRSERLDLDELLLPPGPAPAPGARPASGEDPELPDQLPPLAILGRAEGRITVAADELVLNRTSFTDLAGVVRLDGGRIHLDSATASGFGGRLAGRGLVDLRDPHTPHFDVDLTAQSVQADRLYAYAQGPGRFGRLTGYLNGTIDVAADMQGDLNDAFALDLNSLSSSGTLMTSSARFSGHPLQQSLASYLEMPQLESLSISDWLQPFAVSNGRLTLDGMKLTADRVEVTGRGWQALDGSIQLALDLLLPPDVSAQARRKVPEELAAVLFGGAQERVLLPVVISGRLPQPKVALDLNQLGARAQQRARDRLAEEGGRLEDRIREQAGGLLDGLLGGKKSREASPPPADSAGADTTEQDSTIQAPPGAGQ
jgi:hypothetical protein